MFNFAELPKEKQDQITDTAVETMLQRLVAASDQLVERRKQIDALIVKYGETSHV